jgi:hypothetical protein
VGIPKEIPDASFSTDTILAIGEHRGAGQNTWQICRKKGGVNLALLYTRCATREIVWNLPLTLVCRSCQRPNSTMGNEGPKGVPVKISQLFLFENREISCLKLLICFVV